MRNGGGAVLTIVKFPEKLPRRNRRSNSARSCGQAQAQIERLGVDALDLPDPGQTARLALGPREPGHAGYAHGRYLSATGPGIPMTRTRSI
jgi:hypothetical protein